MRDDEFEFETVWNGVVTGDDGDHLIAGRLAFKCPPPPLRNAQVVNRPTLPIEQRNRNAVIVALYRAAQPLSVADLCFEAGVTGNTVRRVLTTLIARRQVAVGRQRSTYRNYLSVYRLVGARAHLTTASKGAAA